MYVSLENILVAGCAVAAMQSLLMLVTWLQERAARWLLWMCALFVVGGVSLYLFLPSTGLSHPLSAALGTGSFVVTFFLVWTAMRSFEGKPPHWPTLAAGLGTWGAACAIPGALDSYGAAAVMLSALGGLGVGAAAVELWRSKRGHGLIARWLIAGLLGLVAASFALRIPFLALMPFPFGALPMEPTWTAVFVLSLVGAGVVLSILSIMLAKERAGVELRQYALTDQLTGLPNRRAFTVDAAHVARAHSGKATGYCLVMFDLDHFKAINDGFGHALGDRVLQVFAEIARNTLPDRDAFYRLGGEEFCAILPNTSEADAAKVADTLRVAFRSTSVIFGGQSVEVTVSGGVGSSIEAGLDPARVQIHADAALYRAKALGRDCVCVGSHQNVLDYDIGWAAA
jgi:diguanylate cyclase (GGDEF)-like protein